MTAKINPMVTGTAIKNWRLNGWGISHLTETPLSQRRSLAKTHGYNNKKIKLILALFLSLFLIFDVPVVLSSPRSSKNLATLSLNEAINRIIAEEKPSSEIGVLITDVNTGKTLYSRNANYLFRPASAQKLFTAVAALSYLGPTFRFKTQLLTSGDIQKHTLHGDLIIKFSGDPELTTEDLNAMITKLKDLGIREIDGHVYVDNTDYSLIPYPPGWMWDDLSYGYAAPMNAIIINRNKFILHLVPSTKNGQPPKLYPIMPSGVLHFTNEARTIPKHDKECPLTIYSDFNNDYTISGCIPRAWGREFRTLAVRNPLPYAIVLIQQSLENNSIHYQPQILVHKAGPNAIVLAQHLSPPLSEMLKEMLKTSDNLTTDSLLNKMGEVYYKDQGTWHNGIHALQKILKPAGIDFKHNLLDDGAGLSRYNLLTPYQFSQLLQYAYHNDSIRTPLMRALPIGGIDGTLIYRMRYAAKGERVHAKTGTMTGICALAGYVRTQHHGTLAFVIMVNGFVGKARPYRHIQDKICELLATHQGSTRG